MRKVWIVLEEIEGEPETTDVFAIYSSEQKAREMLNTLGRAFLEDSDDKSFVREIDIRDGVGVVVNHWIESREVDPEPIDADIAQTERRAK